MSSTETTPVSFTPRQERLLAAAVRLVAASGLRGLTHRGVDREAGLPEGSCSAYMRTRSALLTRLTEYVIAFFTAEIADLTQRIESHAGEKEYAVSQTGAMLRSWLDEPDLLLVRMELTLEGSRQPAIAAIMQAQAQRLTEVVEHTMLTAGHEHGTARATTLIAAIDGILLRALREPPARRDALTEESLRLLLGGLAGLGTDPGSGAGSTGV